MIRNTLAVIAAYLVFAISSLVLFVISGQPPHADAGIGFKILTLFYGIIFSFLAGWLMQVIAKPKTGILNTVLFFLIAGFALLSLCMSAGAHWTQWLAIFIFAPASAFGGWMRLRKVKMSLKY